MALRRVHLSQRLFQAAMSIFWRLGEESSKKRKRRTYSPERFGVD